MLLRLLSLLASIIAWATPVSAQQIVEWRKQPTDKAILFVHGLAGSANRSFATHTSQWRDIIATDSTLLFGAETLGDFDLFAFDYSGAFRSGSRVTIDELGQQILVLMESNGLFRDYNHIWIVAHSLGGLVVKRALLQLADSTKSSMGRRVVGVFLLGVPSNGAPLANVATKKFMLEYLARAIGEGGQNFNLVEELRASDSDRLNTFLSSTEASWERFIVRMEASPESGNRGYGTPLPKIYCSYETEMEKEFQATGIVVVAQLYAKTRCSAPSQAISKKHTDLPKVSDASDFVHQWLRTNLAADLRVIRTRGPKRIELATPKAIGSILQDLFFSERPMDRYHKDTGLPFVDENAPVPPGEPAPWAKKVLIPKGDYSGSTYADVLLRMSEQQPCFDLKFKDKTRRNLLVGLGTHGACAAFR